MKYLLGLVSVFELTSSDELSFLLLRCLGVLGVLALRGDFTLGSFGGLGSLGVLGSRGLRGFLRNKHEKRTRD